MSTVVRAGSEGYVPPGVAEFELPPYLGSSELATKPILLVVMSVVIITAFFLVTSRRRALVPSRLQFAGEGVYDFVRNGIARASRTLRHLDWFEVTQIRGQVKDDAVEHFQVGLKLGFRLEDD